MAFRLFDFHWRKLLTGYWRKREAFSPSLSLPLLPPSQWFWWISIWLEGWRAKKENISIQTFRCKSFHGPKKDTLLGGRASGFWFLCSINQSLSGQILSANIEGIRNRGAHISHGIFSRQWAHFLSGFGFVRLCKTNHYTYFSLCTASDSCVFRAEENLALNPLQCIKTIW